ncbi:MAG: Uma2 family endonuclease [bacterium]|nr:Uma2 family endonuclease [bacterium]
MGSSSNNGTKIFTYTDYLTWDDNQRWEIIDGCAFNMSPAPERIHQIVSREIFGQLWNQLKGNPCEIYNAPFDVRLPLHRQKEEETINVVQPDISIICDSRKLDKKGCIGPPDLIIEILSPSTAQKDRMDKFNLYEKAGVKEYWLVSPGEKVVEVFILTNRRYGRPQLYSEKSTITLSVIPGHRVDLRTVLNTEAESQTILPKKSKEIRI